MSRETVEARRAAEAQLVRQLEGPCPRCSFGRLVVFTGDRVLGNVEPVARYEMVVDVDDFHYESPEEIRRVDRLIYCPNCGALHEVGGETHYPQSGVVGIPGPVDGADVVELYPSWLRKIT
jgi:hypothetical protein